MTTITFAGSRQAQVAAEKQEAIEAFYQAAFYGDVPALRRALAGGIHPSVRWKHGSCSSPLHYAAQEGRLGAVRLLLRYGADPDALDRGGFSPLRRSSWRFNLEVARELLNRGARKGLIDLLTMLLFDDQKAPVRAIVREYDIDINEKASGGTVLHSMIVAHRASTFSFLLSLGAKFDPKYIDKDFRMNIFCLTASTYYPTALLAMWDLWSEERSLSPVAAKKLDKCWHDAPKRLQRVREKHPDLNWSPAHAAAWLSDQKLMRLAIEVQGTKLDVADRFGFTPLFVAVARKNLTCVRQLIRAGASVGYKNRRAGSVTPLYLAAGFDYRRIARELLQAGADPHSPAAKDRTIAVHATIGHRFSMLKLLAEYGARPDLNFIVEDEGLPLRNHLVELRRDDVIRYIDRLK